MFVFLFDIRLPNKWIAFNKGSPATRVLSIKELSLEKLHKKSIKHKMKLVKDVLETHVPRENSMEVLLNNIFWMATHSEGSRSAEDSKRYTMKVLLNSVHLNGRTLGFTITLYSILNSDT